MGRRKRPKPDPTDDWELLLPLFEWPEQQAYEELRPAVLFGGSVAERARETGTPERTMYRRIERFEKDGMLSLFATDPATARARRRGLEPAIRRMIVELKAEHPKLNANEIANIVYGASNTSQSSSTWQPLSRSGIAWLRPSLEGKRTARASEGRSAGSGPSQHASSVRARAAHAAAFHTWTVDVVPERNARKSFYRELQSSPGRLSRFVR